MSGEDTARESETQRLAVRSKAPVRFQGCEPERLLSELETIETLGLKDRPNPGGALRWLIRTGKLGCVRLGRGVLAFRPGEVADLVERNYRKAGSL